MVGLDVVRAVHQSLTRDFVRGCRYRGPRGRQIRTRKRTSRGGKTIRRRHRHLHFHSIAQTIHSIPFGAPHTRWYWFYTVLFTTICIAHVYFRTTQSPTTTHPNEVQASEHDPIIIGCDCIKEVYLTQSRGWFGRRTCCTPVLDT